MTGHIAVDWASPIGIDGDIEADDVDAASVTAMLLGLPTNAPDTGALWSSERIGAGAFTAINGAVTFKFDRAAFTPALVATRLQGRLRVSVPPAISWIISTAALPAGA